jgi:glycosyltransferase involved in cell wall biosynthesis
MAGYHTLIPSLLSFLRLKKHVIILHGAECNTLSEIGYGIFHKPILGAIAAFSMRHANLLLPVSEYLIYQNNTYLSDPPIAMGLTRHIKGKLPAIEVIHNGVNTETFTIKNTSRREKSFLTVATGLDSQRTYLLKGIDLLLKLARENPDYHITIAGSLLVYDYKNELPNVHIVGPVPNEGLVEIYNEHMYYCQLSMSEGFGVSLCEAMACGCIPIVSRVGIMPDIVGHTGFVLEKRDSSMLDALVRNTVIQSTKKKEDAREQICQRFDIAIREKKLLEAIDHLSNNKSP